VEGPTCTSEVSGSTPGPHQFCSAIFQPDGTKENRLVALAIAILRELIVWPCWQNRVRGFMGRATGSLFKPIVCRSGRQHTFRLQRPHGQATGSLLRPRGYMLRNELCCCVSCREETPDFQTSPTKREILVRVRDFEVFLPTKREILVRYFRCCLSRFGSFICISDGFGHFCGGLETFSVFFVTCWNFSTSFLFQ
jgi:hypothetical protein